MALTATSSVNLANLQRKTRPNQTKTWLAPPESPLYRSDESCLTKLKRLFFLRNAVVECWLGAVGVAGGKVEIRFQGERWCHQDY